MFDYAKIKDMAQDLKVSVKDLLALSPGNDPFYVGSPGQIEKARWFAMIYEKMGKPKQCHIRRVHYWLVSKDIPKPDGTRYENTVRDWGLISLASKYARYAGLVPVENMIDKRNPPPIVNAQFWEHENPTDVQRQTDAESIASDIIKKFYCYNPNVTQKYLMEIWCFPKKTSIVTSDSVKSIEDIKIGDKVLTREGEFNKVTQIFQRNYSGELIKIKAIGLLEFETTPNHPIFVVPVDKTRQSYKGSERKMLPATFTQADNLNIYDRLAIPRTNKVVDIRKIDITIKPLRISGAQPKQLYNIQMDKEFCKILGLYMAEGCISNGRAVKFTFNWEKKEFEELVDNWAKKYGIGTTIGRSPGTRIITINNKALAVWLSDNLGHGAYNKKFPEWFMTLPFDKQLVAIKYHFLGDGTLNDKTRSSLLVSTKSKMLAIQEQVLFARLGFPASIITGTDSTGKLYKVDVAGLFAKNLAYRWRLKLPTKNNKFNKIFMDRNFVYYPIKKISTENYNNSVFNFEVEKSHTYCLPCVVHNCEKSTMNDVLEPIADNYGLNLVAGLGELSITAVHNLIQRVYEADKPVRIFYISDFDPAGECMPVSVARKIEYFMREQNSDADIKLKPIMLTAGQCQAFKLPRTPIKVTERRKDGFEDRYGIGATELDALEAIHPGVMGRIIEKLILKYFDADTWNQAIELNRDIRSKVRDHIDGKITDVLDGLDLEEFDNIEIGTNTEPVEDEDDESWLYDSELDYAHQIDRYKRHKSQEM